jgi:hypothetical protein
MNPDNSFNILKSLVSANSSNTKPACHNYSREKALDDIAEKKPTILLQGGIVSVIKITDKDFEKKYKIPFRDLGCVIPDKIECLIAYNRTIFEYMDKTNGKEWRKEIRKDAIGLNDK